MTSYVESVLAAGENIVYRAKISRWKFLLYYLVGILALAAGPAALIVTGDRSQTGFILAGITMLAGLLILLSAVIRRNTTELVLTNRRIITKRGLISRDTVEMNLSKVESLHVNQSLMGRILNYGDVSVVGTGASLEPLRGIGRPLELRKKLGEIAEVGVPKTISERS
jgi:LPXTG-motif cell wall-anchored protein